MFRDLSLKVKLPMYLTAVLATVIVILAVAAYREVHVAQLGGTTERLQRVSQQLADLTKLSFAARRGEAEALAAEVASAAATGGGLVWEADWVLQAAAEAEDVAAVELRDLDGRRLLAAGDTAGLAGSPFDDAEASAIGPMITAGERTMYASSAPVSGADGRIGSVLMWRVLQIDSVGRRVLADLIGVDAGIVYGSDGGGWTDLATPVTPPDLFAESVAELADGRLLSYERAGAGRVYATVRGIDGAPWFLVTELPQAAVMSHARAFLLRLLLLAPLALLVVAWSAWLIGKTITRSLRETSEAAAAIAAGETGHRVEVRGGDEVGRLALSFNTMAQRIEDSQRALRELNESLSKSNAELENFAYVASHDLREPLRMVRSFTQLLADRYSGQLDEDADKYIHFAVDGATRMEGLIRALLEYSRLDGAPPSPTRTEAGHALYQAVAGLGPAIEESGAEVTSDDLPAVFADADQLSRVFQNLVGNAIKFRGEEVPEVHVGVHVDGEAHVFSVCDNGIGIDPKYFDRIFEIFKRLHGIEEFPGTGMGLTISKKIVERHGGRMWVESTPGEGATFYFTLPRAAAMVA